MKLSAIVAIFFGILSTALCQGIDAPRGGDTTGGGLDNLVCGAVAKVNNVGVTPLGAPSWVIPSGTILSAGQSETWGYANGYVGAIGASLIPRASLKNSSMRALCRGANLNSGQSLGIWHAVTCFNSTIHLVVWGPSLNAFGVSGLQSFTWTAQVNGVTVASGTGEVETDLTTTPLAQNDVVVTVTPSDPDAQGNAMIEFDQF